MLANLFNTNYKREQIYYKGKIKELEEDDQPLIVDAKNINQLLNAELCYVDTFEDYKVLRFLLKTTGELVFAHEGYPGGEIAPHWQMTGVSKYYDAYCTSAGNVFFNENNELICINHKSGDFRPPFDSLQFVLPELIKHQVPMASTLEIAQLNSHGGDVATFTVKSQELIDYYKQQPTPIYQGEEVGYSRHGFFYNIIKSVVDLPRNLFQRDTTTVINQ